MTVKLRHFVCLLALPLLATAVRLQPPPTLATVRKQPVPSRAADTRSAASVTVPIRQPEVLSLAPMIARTTPMPIAPMTSAEFAIAGLRWLPETDFASVKLSAERDRGQRIGSWWEEFLAGFVDPLFRPSDGWHFFDPDTMNGTIEGVRRPAVFAWSGGIKFSRSF